jgi:adenylylsulfate kinase
MTTHETHKRTLAKSITWRVVATIITFVIVFVYTGRIDWAISLSIFDLILKFIGYYAHERVWDRTNWGLLKPS